MRKHTNTTQLIGGRPFSVRLRDFWYHNHDTIVILGLLIAVAVIGGALRGRDVPAPTYAELRPIILLATPQAPPPQAVPTQAPDVAVEAAPAVEPPTAGVAPAEAAPVAVKSYADVVAAQAPHSPRGDVVIEAAPAAPAAPSQVDVNAQAVTVPPLAAAYAENILDRTSNGCPAGQMFYPRTGCHAPGSSGSLPWPEGR